MSKSLRNYLLFTFTICWAMAGVFYLAGLEYGQGLATYALGLPYMLTPGIVAIILDKRAGKKLSESLWVRLRPNRWWLVALIAPLTLSLLALFLSLLIPGVGFDITAMSFFESLADQGLSQEEIAQATAILDKIPPLAMFFFQILQALIAGATINAFFALGEELGWRGLMLRELSHTGFWNSATIIGAVWGLWHAPLIAMGHNYPGYPIIGIAMMILFCMALSPLFSLITLRARSTIAAAFAHGTINASAGFSILYLTKNIPLVTGLPGIIGIATMMLLNLGIFFFIRPTLKAEDWAAEPAAPQ